MATSSKLYTATVLFSASTELRARPAPITQKLRPLPFSPHPPILRPPRNPFCQATEVSKVERGGEKTDAVGDGDGQNWVPAVPLAALPKGERRVIVQGGETILLLWHKTELFAIENRSPAEGAYTEGLLNAKLTQDGCIICPTTDSIFDLQTGDIKEWYPKNPVLRALTPALRKLLVYPVKIDSENIYISIEGGPQAEGSAEIVFSGKVQPGSTASNVNVDEMASSSRARSTFGDPHSSYQSFPEFYNRMVDPSSTDLYGGVQSKIQEHVVQITRDDLRSEYGLIGRTLRLDVVEKYRAERDWSLINIVLHSCSRKELITSVSSLTLDAFIVQDILRHTVMLKSGDTKKITAQLSWPSS